MTSLPPILIVDDDDADVFILKRLLEKAAVKNKTVGFEDARAAVSHLEAEIASGNKLYIPCIIFTDLNMPRMSGFEFAKWVRSHPALSETLVVMVSSSENPKDAARALTMGIDKFIVKYPAPSVLKELVATGRRC